MVVPSKRIAGVFDGDDPDGQGVPSKRIAAAWGDAGGPPFPITLTSDVSAPSLTILVHGESGCGKTTLASTTPPGETLVLSAEQGLLSLRGHDVPAMPVATKEDLQHVYLWLRRGDHPYKWVFIDSLSEIAENMLAQGFKPPTDGPNKGKPPHGPAVYQDVQKDIQKLVKAFRDLPVNVVFIAKQSREMVGEFLKFAPSFPGKRLVQLLPYDVDEVFAMRTRKLEDGQIRRMLQTTDDGQYVAKDRSGALAPYEEPDLSAIAAKIFAQQAPTTGDE